jgi:transposase-like protein
MPVRLKSQPKSTRNKPADPKKTPSSQEAEKKRAILEGVQGSSDSVKGTLKKLGLGQSTYYRWRKQYEAEGVEGLKAGGAVSEKVWERFGALKKKEKEQPEADKPRAQERHIMKSDKDREKTRELLFKRFDAEPSKPEAKAERTPEPGKSKVSDEPPSCAAPPEDPMDRMLKYAMGAFAFVIAILLMASLSNSNNFYFKHKEQMVEMWRGRFAPMGKERVASFSNPKIIQGLPVQSSYTKKQAYGALAEYFIKEADKMLHGGDTPDLKSAKSYLTQASKYAVSDSALQAIRERLSDIQRVTENLQRAVPKP